MATKLKPLPVHFELDGVRNPDGSLEIHGISFIAGEDTDHPVYEIVDLTPSAAINPYVLETWLELRSDDVKRIHPTTEPTVPPLEDGFGNEPEEEQPTKPSAPTEADLDEIRDDLFVIRDNQFALNDRISRLENLHPDAETPSDAEVIERLRGVIADATRFATEGLSELRELRDNGDVPDSATPAFVLGIGHLEDVSSALASGIAGDIDSLLAVGSDPRRDEDESRGETHQVEFGGRGCLNCPFGNRDEMLVIATDFGPEEPTR